MGIVERRCRPQLARKDMHLPAVTKCGWEIAERSGLADELEVPFGQPLPTLVVPQVHRRDGPTPHPAQLLGLRHPVLERTLRLAQDRYRSRIRAGEKRHQAVEQEVQSAWLLCWRCRSRRLCYLG
jgi:hypothetical protein